MIDAAPALLTAQPPGEALRLWFDRLASRMPVIPGPRPGPVPATAFPRAP